MFFPHRYKPRKNTSVLVGGTVLKISGIGVVLNFIPLWVRGSRRPTFQISIGVSVVFIWYRYLYKPDNRSVEPKIRRHRAKFRGCKLLGTNRG